MLKILSPYRRVWFLMLFLSSASTLAGLINPYLTKIAVDEGINRKNFKLLMLIMLAGAGIFLINKFFEGGKEFLQSYIKNRVNFDLNRKLIRHMQGLSLGWFCDKSTGAHIYKIDYDVDAVTDFLCGLLPQALFIFPKLLFILVIIFFLNWRMAVFLVCLGPLLYLPSYFLTQRMKRICEDLINSSEDIFEKLVEIFSHIYLIKVFSKEISSTVVYLRLLIKNIRIRLKAAGLEIVSSAIDEAAVKIMTGLIILYGGYQVINGGLTLGTLTAILAYLYQLMGLQSQFISFFRGVVTSLVSYRRLGRIFEEKPQVVEVKDCLDFPFKKGGIVFNNVTFAYTAGNLVFKNISFQIEPGMHIAIAGESGCGKSTLLNLLLRLYDPLEGDILIDGCNIKNMSFNSLRRQIGFSFQEPFLCNDSIENNIRYGRQDASDNDILAVSRITGVDEFAANLAKGYKTVIGEGACKISEGQKQKLAIARALIKNPKVLILDEAMSSLDSMSEEKIISGIKGTYDDSTLIIVSHRLSTVMLADLVYYLAGSGKMLIDKGRNLLEYNKGFAQLFAAQEKYRSDSEKRRESGNYPLPVNS